jgi:hypothetical protein
VGALSFWDVLNSPGWGALESVGTAVAVGVAAWAARQANATASKLAEIEGQRRHSELCPVLRVTCEHFNAGSEILTLRVMLSGPPGLDRVDGLAATIRNDHFLRGQGHQEFFGGPTEEDIKRHVWGPYRFTPHVGPDKARADSYGREVVYTAPLPIGEELRYQLERSPKGQWMSAMTDDDWLRQQGTVIRLAFTAESEEHGIWHLPCEIDTSILSATVYVPQRIGEVLSV